MLSFLLLSFKVSCNYDTLSKKERPLSKSGDSHPCPISTWMRGKRDGRRVYVVRCGYLSNSYAVLMALYFTWPQMVGPSSCLCDNFQKLFSHRRRGVVLCFGPATCQKFRPLNEGRFQQGEHDSKASTTAPIIPHLASMPPISFLQPCMDLRKRNPCSATLNTRTHRPFRHLAPGKSSHM